MNKPKIAFVTGGYSGEAEVSYKSAITIQNNLDAKAYDVYRIDIRKDGWYYQPEAGEETTVNKNDFSVQHNGTKIQFDGVFIGIHGTPGEDGKLQGYFDMLNLPYTSCNAATSAITFNKRYTVAVAQKSGIAVAHSELLFKNQDYNISELIAKLKFPVFVKPNNGGSSIGMSKVKDGKDLAEAITKAFKEDDQVLIEEMIIGREFTVGVYKANNQITPLPVTEVITKKDFFDFEAKYSAGFTDEITPAAIDNSLTLRIQQTAAKIFALFNCSGVIRIDFIYNQETDTIYMLEVNTVPGQSQASIIPQQVRAAGMELKAFYSGLIQQGIINK
jgi:D-alanine-D-alanine ligase